MPQNENFVLTCQFVKIKRLKDAEIGPREHSVQNVPPAFLWVGVEQRLHGHAVREQEYERNYSEVEQFTQL